MRYQEIITEGFEGIELPDKLEWRQAPSAKTGVMQTFLTAYQWVKHENGSASRRDMGQLCIYREPDGTIDISRIQVRPDARKQGLATALMNRMFDLTGAQEVTVSTGFTGDGSAFFNRMFKVEHTDLGILLSRR